MPCALRPSWPRSSPCPDPLAAREYEVEIRVESIEDIYELERLGELEGDDVSTLAALFENPLNVNRADRNLLYDLPGITLALADAIVAWRAEHGNFTSIAALGDVPGMTPDLVAMVTPFVSVGGAADLPGAATSDFHGVAKMGSIWRQGFARDESQIDWIRELDPGPQSFLKIGASGFTYLAAGAQLSYRRRTDVSWDNSIGYLVSDGPGNQFDLDTVFLRGGYGPWSVVLGSYTVGFGERLTFDSTTRTLPNGLSDPRDLQDDQEKGLVKPSNSQFGIAAALSGAEIGNAWLDATVFGSYVRDDLYQYDFNYGLDAASGTNACDTDGDCPAGYSCGEDLRCHSTRIYNASDPSVSYLYLTMADAYEEKLVGANVTVHFDERSQVGVTGYGSWTEVLVAQDAEGEFSHSARLPRHSPFGAVGVNGSFGIGDFEIAGEYTRTLREGNGAFVRATYEPGPFLELNTAFRYYDSRFENPHGRGKAQRDELLGLAARNEVGGSLDATVKPISRLRFVTKLDLWTNPELPVYQTDGSVDFVDKENPPLDLMLVERVQLDITSKEDAAVSFSYKNKDVGHNSRTEYYDRGDYCDEGLSLAQCGRGERRRLQLRVATDRIPHTRVWVSYTASWEDQNRLAEASRLKPEESRTPDDYVFDFSQQLRLHGTVSAWPGGRVTANVGFWIHDPAPPKDNPYLVVISDRDEPALNAYLELRQKIGSIFTVWARYGVLNYDDESLGRYPWYHLMKLVLEAKI